MDSSHPLNPVEVEQHLRGLTTRIAKGITVASNAYKAQAAAKRDFDRAYAAAYLGAEGPVEDRKQKAVQETMLERREFEVAEAAYRHADRLLKALDSELRSTQSISALVRGAYGVAGRGE